MKYFSLLYRWLFSPVNNRHTDWKYQHSRFIVKNEDELIQNSLAWEPLSSSDHNVINLSLVTENLKSDQGTVLG